MDLNLLQKENDFTWRVDPHGNMRVPVVFYADETLLRDMDDKVYQQACNVATLPGIVKASYAMPDAHWGYGFPIGGVAASMLKRVAWYQAGVSVLIFHVVCARCIPV